MSKLKYTETKSNGILKAKLEGEIIDGSSIPDPDLAGITAVELDLDGVRYLNSSGARLWMLWSGKLIKGPARLVLQNVRPVFIRTLATIRDFLPKGSKMESVYVPYFCEACNTNFDRRMVAGKDFTRQCDSAKLETFPCPKCGKPAEIDALVENYVQAMEAFA